MVIRCYGRTNPVSALIHAATMVIAGIFLLCQIRGILEYSPIVCIFIYKVGIITAFFGSLAACVQHDIKKIIAYSTTSQLGYLFAGCGVLAFANVLSHLLLHAFIKATIFLCAGSVIHFTGLQTVNKVKHVFSKNPMLGIIFILSILSLSAFPFFGGFYSKDALLDIFFRVTPNSFYFYLILVSAFNTVFYSLKLIQILINSDRSPSKQSDLAKGSEYLKSQPLFQLEKEKNVRWVFMVYDQITHLRVYLNKYKKTKKILKTVGKLLDVLVVSLKYLYYEEQRQKKVSRHIITFYQLLISVYKNCNDIKNYVQALISFKTQYSGLYFKTQLVKRAKPKDGVFFSVREKLPKVFDDKLRKYYYNDQTYSYVFYRTRYRAAVFYFYNVQVINKTLYGYCLEEVAAVYLYFRLFIEIIWTKIKVQRDASLKVSKINNGIRQKMENISKNTLKNMNLKWAVNTTQFFIKGKKAIKKTIIVVEFFILSRLFILAPSLAWVIVFILYRVVIIVLLLVCVGVVAILDLFFLLISYHFFKGVSPVPALFDSSINSNIFTTMFDGFYNQSKKIQGIIQMVNNKRIVVNLYVNIFFCTLYVSMKDRVNIVVENLPIIWIQAKRVKESLQVFCNALLDWSKGADREQKNLQDYHTYEHYNWGRHIAWYHKFSRFDRFLTDLELRIKGRKIKKIKWNSVNYYSMCSIYTLGILIIVSKSYVLWWNNYLVDNLMENFDVNEQIDVGSTPYVYLYGLFVIVILLYKTFSPKPYKNQYTYYVYKIILGVENIFYLFGLLGYKTIQVVCEIDSKLIVFWRSVYTNATLIIAKKTLNELNSHRIRAVLFVLTISISFYWLFSFSILYLMSL